MLYISNKLNVLYDWEKKKVFQWMQNEWKETNLESLNLCS